MAPQKLQRAALSPSAIAAASTATATAQRGGTYGAITPNPRTISGKTGTVKVLYMTGRTYITMYIMWDGPGFPNDLIVSLSTTAGEPLPDVTLSYVDFFDDMAIYEFGGDPDLTEQLYEFFRPNVGNTVPCEISDAMPQP